MLSLQAEAVLAEIKPTDFMSSADYHALQILLMETSPEPDHRRPEVASCCVFWCLERLLNHESAPPILLTYFLRNGMHFLVPTLLRHTEVYNAQ